MSKNRRFLRLGRAAVCQHGLCGKLAQWLSDCRRAGAPQRAFSWNLGLKSTRNTTESGG